MIGYFNLINKRTAEVYEIQVTFNKSDKEAVLDTLNDMDYKFKIKKEEFIYVILYVEIPAVDDSFNQYELIKL